MNSDIEVYVFRVNDDINLRQRTIGRPKFHDMGLLNQLKQ